MKPDLTAFNAGLLFIALAGAGLCGAFGLLDWRMVSVGAPLTLVVIGLAGLVLSRLPLKTQRKDHPHE